MSMSAMTWGNDGRHWSEEKGDVRWLDEQQVMKEESILCAWGAVMVEDVCIVEMKG